MQEDKIEIYVKHGEKTLRAVLSENAVKEIDDMREKIGTTSIIEAILYSIRIFVEGIKEIESGEKKENITLPNGKKVDISLKIE